MSKRGAEEYITKEHGSTPNTESGEAKVKMATAAQMAKRKMAVPKSRAGRSGGSPMPGAGISNPFANTSTFGSTQNNSSPAFTNTAGTTFGVSQSFPPNSTSASNSFTFSVPGQSSSFTFGQPVANNPFAGLNGIGPNQQQPSQESNDTVMESPQKKPAFGSDVFGSKTDGSNQTPGLSFGQPPSQPLFSFGQSQPLQTNGFGGTAGSSIFGQSTSKSPEKTPTNNPFGQSANGQTSQSPATGLFGQPSKSPPVTQTSEFKFGQSTSAATSSTPAFSFGQPPPQTSSTPPLFGTSTQTSQATFGSSTPATQSTTGAPLFGSSSATSGGSLFGGFGGPDAAEASASSVKSPLFGQPTTTSTQESLNSTSAEVAPKSNPFAGLFAPSPSKDVQAISSATKEPSKPAFSFGEPPSSSGLFGPPKSNTVDASSTQASETSKKQLFNFGSPASIPNAGISSPAKSSTESPTNSNPFAGLAHKASESEKADTVRSVFDTAKDTANSSATGFKALPPLGGTPSNKTSSSTSATSSTLFGGDVQASPSTPMTAQKPQTSSHMPQKGTYSDTPATSNPFASLTEAPQPATTINSVTPKQPSTTSDALATASKPEPIIEAPKRSVNTNPPTRIPSYLDGEDYKSYDSNYRLHSLNREFQRRIATLDPSREDFENIIRNYVAARESIGESIGLYVRNVAGMKRKPDSDDDAGENGSSTFKKSKTAGGSTSASSAGVSQSASSIFQPVPPSASTSKAVSTNFSPTKMPASGTSSASVLFSSMIPNNATPQSSVESTASSKPTFLFASTPNKAVDTGSTTPTKSPPKKSGFELPKFASAGKVNFMDSFKKQSDTSAKLLAKTEKEKRKAEDFDSDEETEEEWERKYEAEEKAKRAKVEAVTQKGFLPSFATSSSTTSQNIFGSVPTPTAGNTSDKPIDISDNDFSADAGAEGQDSTGDSGDTENDEEEEQEEEESEGNEDDLPEDEVNGDNDEEEEDQDLETTLAQSRNKGKSLFDRVTPNPKLQKDQVSKTNEASSGTKSAVGKSSTFANSTNKETPEAPSFSPLTPSGSKDTGFVPSKTFNFTPTPPTTTPTPTPGASIFAGGAVKEGPISGEGLFGSRPSTPSNADQPKTSMFGGFGTPLGNSASDHTWKKGSQIKFGTNGQEAPTLNITEATPKKDEFASFTNLFGAPSTSASNTTGNNIGFSFGQQAAPGFLSAASYLNTGTGTSSGLSSRATSPGTTDNESVATNEEDFANDTQVSLMDTRPGEENEQVVIQSRARAMRLYTEDQIKGTKLVKGWNSMGVGDARLLKDKSTGKTRLVMRAEPGANILINTGLRPEVKYEYSEMKDAGVVKFSIFTNEGVQPWLIKVKSSPVGREFARAMEENKNMSA